MDTVTNTTNVSAEEEEKNEGTLYMIFFVMAQIGGLYSFFKMVLGSIINGVQYKMMLIEIINKFNHRRIEDSIKRKKTKQLEKALLKQKSRENFNNAPEDSKIHDGGEEEYNVHPQNPDNDLGSGDYIRQKIEKNMSKLEATHHNFEYNCSDLFYQTICCFKTKPSNDLTEEESLGSRHDQFIKDLDKFSKEIDVINLISNVKDLKYAVNDIYSEIEKMKSQETVEPQTDKDSFNGVVAKKMKLKSSAFDPVQLQAIQKDSINFKSQINDPNKFKSSVNESIIEKPEEIVKDEKQEENYHSEVASDLNNVNFKFSTRLILNISYLYFVKLIIIHSC